MSSSILPLSVTLIARNEAHNLNRSLKSVTNWAKEIVVVINDCSDETAFVAKSYGARVYEHAWHGHRDQKNIALDYASQPWIFALDADEEISVELKASIVRFIQEDDPRYAGAYFARKVWFLGRWITHGDWYPDYSLRLIRKGKGRFYGSTEHDKMKIEGKAKKLKGALHHYSYPNLASTMEKINYFSDIYLERQIDAKKKWSLWNVIFRPLWRFVRAYFLRGGCLDGFAGFYIATLTAFATFVRHSRLYEHEKVQLNESDSPHQNL